MNNWKTVDNPSGAKSIMNELDLFLVENNKDINSLHKYPRIDPFFLRFNTSLPLSTPVKRFISAGPLVLTIRTNRLSDELFETSDFESLQKSLTGVVLLMSALLRHNWIISFLIYILKYIIC